MHILAAPCQDILTRRCPYLCWRIHPGRIGKVRLLGDLQHSTRIAFIEFVDAEAAMEALNCSGALLGEYMQ